MKLTIFEVPKYKVKLEMLGPYLVISNQYEIGDYRKITHPIGLTLDATFGNGNISKGLTT